MHLERYTPTVIQSADEYALAHDAWEEARQTKMAADLALNEAKYELDRAEVALLAAGRGATIDRIVSESATSTGTIQSGGVGAQRPQP